MGFMDFDKSVPADDIESRVRKLTPEEREAVRPIREHVDFLLENNGMDKEGGTAQFTYLKDLPPITLMLIIGGLLGHIAGLGLERD